MKKLLEYGNEFARQSTWKDFALVKICLLAMGLMWGMALPKKAKKPAVFVAVAAFAATYVPLILKLLRVVNECRQKNGSQNA